MDLKCSFEAHQQWATLVTATVNVLWGNWFKKLELFKVNVWWYFIPILCECIRILFKDHYLRSWWAATLQVNSYLAANKYGLGKSETKHLPEIQPLVKKTQARVRGVCLEHSRKDQNFALWNPWHSELFFQKQVWFSSLLGFSYWKAMSFTQASDTDPSAQVKIFFLPMRIVVSFFFSFLLFVLEAMEGPGYLLA